MYRLVNCVVRYTRSVTTSKKTKGAFFHSRVSQTLPKNLYGSIWNAVMAFMKDNVLQPELIRKCLQPFSAITKEPIEARDEVSEEFWDKVSAILDPVCLREYAPKIHWNSNIMCPEWNPSSVAGIDSQNSHKEYSIWTGDCITQNSPYRFRKWVQKVLRPQEEPMALLLHVLNHMNVLKGSHFYAYSSVDYVLSRLVTPRY